MTDTGSNHNLQTAVNRALHQRWSLFLLEGIVLLLLGILAVIVPQVATLAFTVFLGWLFVISGVVGLVTTFGAREAPGFWWSLFSAALALAAGFMLAFSPMTGALSLTLILAVFFVMEGVASIMYAFAHRDQLSGRWMWMLVSGVVDILLAGMLVSGFPGTAVWAVGLLAGINLIFGGMALIAIALHAKATP
jgi:uncharacterized membrane protein HdeD (DUF308 family)